MAFVNRFLDLVWYFRDKLFTKAIHRKKRNLLADGKVGEALDVVNYGLQHVSDDLGLLIAKGNLSSALNIFEDALKAYQKATDLSDNFYAYFYWGEVLQRVGRYKESIPVLEKSLNCEGTLYHTYRYLGEAHAREGNLELSAEMHSKWFDNWIQDDKQSLAFRQQHERGVQAGITTPIYMACMQKSGSEYLMLSMTSALDIPLLYSTIGTIPRDIPIQSTSKFVSQGGVVIRTHMEGSLSNLELLKQAGINKLLVHIRDPRQVVLSWTHMIRNLSEAEFLSSKYMYSPCFPDDFPQKKIQECLDWAIENYLPGQIKWLRDWFDAAQSNKDIEIMITTFNDMYKNKHEFFNNISKFFDIPAESAQKISESLDPEKQRNYRKGSTEEWKTAFSKEQKAKMDRVIPREIIRKISQYSVI